MLYFVSSTINTEFHLLKGMSWVGDVDSYGEKEDKDLNGINE